jgi:hypothetical protein
MSKCIYCKCEISDGRVIEVCDLCGRKVWGKKMFNTIVQNMDTARDKGDLCHMNNTCDLSNEISR